MTIDTTMFETVTTHALVDHDRLASLLGGLDITPEGLRILDDNTVRGNIEQLARIAAFGPPEAVLAAHQLTWQIAQTLGIFPASINTLYRATGSGAIDRQVSVPAINMRAVAFHSARGVFQAMRSNRAGAVIFELSRGEIGFTAQRPHEYAVQILCAAIAEEYSGPVFLQGDHYQISASRYAIDPEKEVQAVEELIREAVSAGFYNIDIDASTLVDLSFEDITRQQLLNIQLTARLSAFTRALEPTAVTISLGGEIGEVGEHNSTTGEVRAYLGGVEENLPSNQPGLSKISVQTGTRHGGNVLADGSFGDMPIDFGLIKQLSQVCRDEFGLAGCVQHGASMLSLEKIAKLPAADCTEVHLAAAFLNVVYDSLPDDVVNKADDWAKQSFAHEWKTDWSEAQFLHHARRYPIGPFKEDWWRLDACHAPICEAVRGVAEDYINALGAAETMDLVSQYVGHGPVAWCAPTKAIRVDGEESQISDLAS